MDTKTGRERRELLPKQHDAGGIESRRKKNNDERPSAKPDTRCTEGNVVVVDQRAKSCAWQCDMVERRKQNRTWKKGKMDTHKAAANGTS